MDDFKLQSILNSEITNATGFLGGELSEERRKALDYYYGKPFGNEVEGRSQVVMTEVRDVIESTLPGLVEIFLAGDEAVIYEPVGIEDEEFANQATEYINYLFLKRNNGFKVLTDWFKDGLLSKVGYVKCWWETYEKVTHESFEGLTEDELAELISPESVEVLEQDEIEGVYDLKIRKTEEKGRLRVSGVPPEEILISRRAKSMEDATFVGHRVRYTVSELKQMGYDPDLVDSLPSDTSHEYSLERTSRFQNDDEWPYDTVREDDAGRHVWVVEAYLTVDYDEDGIAELRQITCADDGSVILDNQEIDEIPIVDFCPVPIPHKFFGMSLADFVMDLQQTKSAVMRQMLDNMYLMNNGRTLINESVNLDDMLTNRPGQVVRTSASNVGTAAAPLVTQSLGPYAYPLMEYLDTVREVRTGVTRYNQGLDADSLNKTATGIKMIQGLAAKRQQMLARHAADSVGRLFKMMLRMVVRYADSEDIIRLRGEMVEMDPRPWNAEMDVTVSVGLGHGTKDEQMQSAMLMLQTQQQIIAHQGGADGPLVTEENIYNTAKKLVEASGLRHVAPYFTDPRGQERGPDPAVQMEMQMRQKELEFKEREVAVKERELQLEARKAADKTILEQKELDIRRMEAQGRIRAKENEIDARYEEIDTRAYAAEVAAESKQESGNEARNQDAAG